MQRTGYNLVSGFDELVRGEKHRRLRRKRERRTIAITAGLVAVLTFSYGASFLL